MEFSTSSPPPYYNFAKIPNIHSIDEWAFRKEHGVAYPKITNFERIHMPCNTWAAPIIGISTIPFGFAFVWHIWWLVILSMAVMAVTFVMHGLFAKREYYIEISEVEAIEKARWESLRRAGKVADDDDPETPIAQPVPEWHPKRKVS